MIALVFYEPTPCRMGMAAGARMPRPAFHCVSGGFYADAISRAYYAVLHAAKSVLRLRGIDARSHMGVVSLFGSNMVRRHLIEGHWSDEIDSLHDLRINADRGGAPGNRVLAKLLGIV